MYASEKKFHEKSRLPIQKDESKKVHSLFTRSKKKLVAYTQDLEKKSVAYRQDLQKKSVAYTLSCQAYIP